MFNIKKIIGDKAQMSGMQKLLKSFGFDIEKLIPEAERSLLAWFQGMEEKAGAPLTAVAMREGDQFLIGLYKQIPGGLEKWGETFALSDFKKFLNDLENLENSQNGTNIENRSIAECATVGGATADSGATAIDYEPTADTGAISNRPEPTADSGSEY